MNDREHDTDIHRCGYVAIIGRPNVGKSTLLNRLVGQKIAIVSPKPQTTRKRILGVTTSADAQILFLDTPGWHAAHSLINKRMLQGVETALADADVVLWVVDASGKLRDEDLTLARRLAKAKHPVCVALNKIDRRARANLLPLLDELQKLLPESDVVPVSAIDGENIEALLPVLTRALPEGPALYDDDMLTDQTERMLVEECVREQVLLQLREEIPYAVGVVVEKFEERNNLVVISAAIQVERKSQKAVVIGARGARIKEIGKGARVEVEKILGRRVYLELFVRVQADWTRDPRRLAELGL